MAETYAVPREAAPILVPLDGSALAEQAIPYAAALASPADAIVFLQVVPSPQPIRGLLGNVLVPADDVVRLERDAAEQSLQQATDHWRSILSAAPRHEVAVGDPADAILATAARLGCSLIVLASHGRGAVGRLAFGSVADRVARMTTIPVLIVRPIDAAAEVARPDIRRLVVPLDGSELAREALPVAASLARRVGAPVHLVQAVNPAAAVIPAPVGSALFPTEIYSEIEQELRAVALTTLEAASKELAAAGLSVTSAVLDGPAAGAIEDAVALGDLIVMTSHGRTGVTRWLMGSVAEKLVRSGPVPVVLVPASTRGR